MWGKNMGARMTDEELDLVETPQLIAALGRRYQAMVLALLSQPGGCRFQIESLFLPNVVACSGIMDSLCTSHDIQMRRMRCSTVKALREREKT